MREKNDLVLIEKANALEVFSNKEQLDPLIEAIEKEARSLVPDVKTVKGRDAIRSMAFKVAQSKTYIDNAGKELVSELKALPKKIDESRRLMRERLDALRDEVRRPLTEWEAEQERQKAEEEARREAEELAKQIDSDHEIALLLNNEFDRKKEEARLKAEQEQREREEEIKREAEEKAQAEIKAAQLKAEEEKQAREQLERQRIEDRQRAEHEKQEAVEDERKKAQEKIERLERELLEAGKADQIVENVLGNIKEKRRQDDIEHRRRVNRQSVEELLRFGIPLNCAKKCVEAIAKNSIAYIKINY